MLAASLLPGQVMEIRADRIRAHVKFLSSDLLEGRAPGERGGALAEEYLAAQFALVGARPAGENGTYFQKVPLIGVATEPTSTLSIAGRDVKLSFKWLDEFVGQTRIQRPSSSFDAEAVFVGHGITAPEYGWDDYAGVDVKGKAVILFTGEPPSEDPSFFNGRALTYYGRWTYKYEEAARRGAVAAIIIHTTPTASYGWEVVRSSWGREDTQVRGDSTLAFAGWITTEAANKVAQGFEQSVESLLKMAGAKGFRALPLPFRVRGTVNSRLREIETRNVAARIDGTDPALKDQVVIFSAHWDHLGKGEPVNGDSIYNGAVDNATGCGMLIEIARAWAALPQKPRRSALFLAVTAEEGGLRGSEYYAKNPLVPAAQTAVNLNFDAYYPFGRTRDVVLTGAERTTLWPMVQQTAERFEYEIKPDPRPEAGSYYRSDHFSFARTGIPAFSVNAGNEYLGKPADFGSTVARDYTAKRYHQPSDEYNDDWDLSGMEHLARFGFTLGLNAANDPKLPTWKTGDEFLPARQASGVR